MKVQHRKGSQEGSLPPAEQPSLNKKEDTSTTSSSTLYAIFLVMFGCGLNNISLEFIIRLDPSAGNIVTFAQFLLIALEGLYVHMEWPEKRQEGNTSWWWFLPRLRGRVIPLAHYLVMVAIFFTVSTLNNAALGYQISLPLHMIFRSGSLIATALIGCIFFKENYAWSQYIAVLIVSCGIFAATTASAQAKAPVYEKGAFDLWTWVLGVMMLFVSLVLSSVLSFYQNYAYRKYGDTANKPYRETQFYSHALALPFFVIIWPDIVKHAELWSTFPTTEITGIGAVPVIWLYLLANVVTQYICISGVFMLTGNVSPLTTNLVIAVRKFASLAISVFYFGNLFTATHWMAAIAVFFGTFLYSVSNKPPATARKPNN